MPRTTIPLPRLQSWRIRRGWTQQDLADAAGTTRANVGQIETGRRTTPRMAARLAEALGCEIADLLAAEH